MPDQPLITSLLDTDLYKLTMMQAFYHAPEFTGVETEWKFDCRNLDETGTNLAMILPLIKTELDRLCELRFSQDELHHLAEMPFFKESFISFLQDFHLKKEHIHAHALSNGGIELRFSGPLLSVCLFEIYALAIISELNTLRIEGGFDINLARTRLQDKLKLLDQTDLQGLVIADFSTRRRATKTWQYEMVEMFKAVAPGHLAGTSNIFLAWQLGIAPIGTMAHEWLQAWQGIAPLAVAQRTALEGWVREYHGSLGVALTDNYSMDAFCRDITTDMARTFSGLRHDSGDPIRWGERAIELYRSHNVEPKTRTLVFSDSLDFPRAIEIYRYFNGRVKMAFGIGTNLGNDVGIKALNIVIKMVRANGQPVAKISDEPGKSICEDQEYLQQVAEAYAIKLD